MSAASDASLPDRQALEAHALRTVAASLGRRHDALGVIAHETGDVDPARLQVDVRSRSVIRREAEGARGDRRPAWSDSRTGRLERDTSGT